MRIQRWSRALTEVSHLSAFTVSSRTLTTCRLSRSASPQADAQAAWMTNGWSQSSSGQVGAGEGSGQSSQQRASASSRSLSGSKDHPLCAQAVVGIPMRRGDEGKTVLALPLGAVSPTNSTGSATLVLTPSACGSSAATARSGAAGDRVGSGSTASIARAGRAESAGLPARSSHGNSSARNSRSRSVDNTTENADSSSAGARSSAVLPDIFAVGAAGTGRRVRSSSRGSPACSTSGAPQLQQERPQVSRSPSRRLPSKQQQPPVPGNRQIGETSTSDEDQLDILCKAGTAAEASKTNSSLSARRAGQVCGVLMQDRRVEPSSERGPVTSFAAGGGQANRSHSSRGASDRPSLSRQSSHTLPQLVSEPHILGTFRRSDGFSRQDGRRVPTADRDRVITSGGSSRPRQSMGRSATFAGIGRNLCQ